MKKIALVLAVLLVVGGAAFAEVMVGGEATVSGSVSTTLGMDLQSGVWGADADSSISISIPLANGTDGVAGDDDMYGEIMLTGVSVNINALGDTDDAYGYDEDNDFGDLAARIVAGDIYVGLNWGGYNNNYASVDSDYDINLDDDWYTANPYGDLAFGFSNGMFAVELEVAAKSGITRADDETDEVTIADWTVGYTASADATATTQADTGLVFSVDVEYTSDMITFPVYVTLDPEYAADTMLLGVSVNPSVAVGAFSMTAPVDFVMIGDESGFDAAPTVSYMVTDAVTLGADAYYYNYVDNMSFLDAGVTVSTDGLVSGLTASVDVCLSDVMSDVTGAELGWGVDLAVGYALADGLTLSLAPGYDSTDDLDIAGSLSFGSAFTGIDNTCIVLDYASGCYDLTDGAADVDAGVVSLATTISF